MAFIVDMIVYVENLKESGKKALELIRSLDCKHAMRTLKQ